MKKLLFLIVALMVFGGVKAQKSAMSEEELSIFSTGIEGCYSNYYIAFHERGAMEVPDGEHETVLVVINQGRSQCYMAKINVVGGKIAAPLLVQKEDGAFVPATRMFKGLDDEWEAKQDLSTLNQITDGMSRLFKSEEGYWLRVFFHTFIAPDHGGNKQAPPAAELLKTGE